MTDRVYSWVRLSDTVWEHEPSGTKLVLDDGEWCVRFPNTTAVPWTVEDAMAMMHVMLGRPLIDAAKLALSSGVSLRQPRRVFRPGHPLACNASPTDRSNTSVPELGCSPHHA